MPDSYRTCSVEGCERQSFAKGYCQKHYNKFRKRGDLLVTAKYDAMGLVKQVVADPPNKCVNWPYTKNRGYGRFWYKGATYYAHRLALELYTGQSPRDLDAIHGPCNNPACFNPLHLRWGTEKDNMDDQVRDGTRVRGEKMWACKITKEQAIAIKARLKTERTVDIAKDMGINRQTICAIKRGRSWAWLE